MTAPSLDNEFMQYWLKLSVVHKKSLLSVIKSFQSTDDINPQYNKDIDEAVERVDSGVFLTQNEVEKMSKEW